MLVRIFQPTKTSTQSPDYSKNWVLEFVPQDSKTFRDSVTKRTASMYMLKEVHLKFTTLKAAKSFAKMHNYQYEIIQPKHRSLIKKSYAENFC